MGTVKEQKQYQERLLEKLGEIDRELLEEALEAAH